MRTTTHLALCGSLLLLTGCALFAAGAGAGAGIYLTSRGAESTFEADIGQTVAATRQTFRAMNIEETGADFEYDDGEAELSGTLTEGENEKQVTVEIERTDDGLTHVEVTVKDNIVQWDKEFARKVLQKLVERAGGEPRAGLGVWSAPGSA